MKQTSLCLASVFLAATVVWPSPAQADEEPFTIAVLPDTQGLVASHPQLWTQQAQWIVDHQVERNIKAVIHVGDLVDNAQLQYQWTNARAGLDLIKNAGIPLILAPGNHDMDTNAVSQAMTALTRELPQSWFTSNTNWTGGFLDNTNLAGSYLLVTNGPTTYLLVALAWLPNDRSANWARTIMDQFSNCPAIFATHCFVDDTKWGRRASWTQTYSVEAGYGDMSPWWTPNRLWSDCLSKTKNLFWVISGHLWTDLNSVYFSEPAEDGHIVTESLCDYQNLPPTYRTDSAFMQLLTVYRQQNQCHIETFSTRTGETRTNWNEDYTFPIQATTVDHRSLWQEAWAGATNGLVLWNGFDRTNSAGFAGLSSFGTALAGAVAVAPGGIYVNCYPAFSNMVSAVDMDALTGMSNMTASVWFRGTNAAPSGLGIVIGKFNGSTDGEWYLAVTGPSALRFALVNTNSIRVNLDVSTPIPVLDGQWHHLAATYDGYVAKLYFDGEPAGSVPFSGRLKGTRNLLSVGGLGGKAAGFPTSSPNTPLGWLDRVKVWVRALSAEEIAVNYANGLASLEATRTNDVISTTLTSASVATEPGKQYLLRFAVAGNSTIAGQQNLVAAWNGTTVADLSLIQTNAADTTNWIYTTVVVTATNTSSALAFQGSAGDLVSITGTNSGAGPLLADFSAVPFAAPEISPPAFLNSKLNFDCPSVAGLAYQLQTSSDLVHWQSASRWIVAAGTNLNTAIKPPPGEVRYFRVQVTW